MTIDLNAIPHLDELRLRGSFQAEKSEKMPRAAGSRGKIVPSLEKAVVASGLKSGMTISFHHHFRDGDSIVNMVVDKLAVMGFKDLVVAPSCDPQGNANGYVRDSESGIKCGAMGYAKTDARYADKTIVITNNIVPYPNVPFSVPDTEVDYVVEVDEIGDPSGIMAGAARFTRNPKELLMARRITKVIEASGRFRDGFSFQLGLGATSLAVARFLREKMLAKGITASFALGGITGPVVKLLEEGLVKRILDVQSFDLEASESVKKNMLHQQISAGCYADPANPSAAVNQVDVVVLSALEVDTGFNVNIITGSDGIIRGSIGGHPDTAFGSAVSIVVCPLTRGRIPCVVDRVGSVVTPGNTVDVVITERGVAVNPGRADLRELLTAAGVDVTPIEVLREYAAKLVGASEPVRYLDKIVGVVTYRDGSVLDVIRQVKD